jgi:hypothetical protein
MRHHVRLGAGLPDRRAPHAYGLEMALLVLTPFEASS